MPGARRSLALLTGSLLNEYNRHPPSGMGPDHGCRMSDGFAIQKAGFLVIPGLGVGVGMTHLTLRKASWFSQCNDTTPRMPGARRSLALLTGSLLNEYTSAQNALRSAAAPQSNRGPGRAVPSLVELVLY